MVRVNVTHAQNSGMVNFVPESGAFIICTNQFRCTEKCPRRPKTGIKDGFSKEIEARKFSSGTTQIVVFHPLSDRIFREVFVNRKQP